MILHFSSLLNILHSMSSIICEGEGEFELVYNDRESITNDFKEEY
jgi:hypothetical protein